MMSKKTVVQPGTFVEVRAQVLVAPALAAALLLQVLKLTVYLASSEQM